MKLRWEKQQLGWTAMSGEKRVGFVVDRDGGTFYYEITAVSTKWITKGYGEVRSLASAKRSLERAWAAWLNAFDLEPRKGSSDSPERSRG